MYSAQELLCVGVVLQDRQGVMQEVHRCGTKVVMQDVTLKMFSPKYSSIIVGRNANFPGYIIIPLVPFHDVISFGSDVTLQ